MQPPRVQHNPVGESRDSVSSTRINLLKDTAEENIKSASYDAVTLGQPDNFIDPCRAMLSLGLNLGR